MRRAWTALLAFSATPIFCPPARAQWQGSVDVGVSRLRQTGIPESAAQTVGATIDGFGARSWFHGAALSSLQPNNAWTGQAIAAAGVSGPIVDRWNWELGGAASGFGQTGAANAASGQANARLRFGVVTGGVALGAATGLTSRDAERATFAAATVDAWWSAAQERLVVTVAPTHAGSVNYTDLGAGWRHDGGGLAVGASAGVRTANGGGWQAVDAEFWFVPRLALVIGAGNALADVVRGTPSTRYVSAAVRVAWQTHSALWPTRGPRGVRVVVTRTSPELARIDVTVREASRVELMADFTGWEPVSLTRGGEAWFIERAITPGLHRIAIRIDDGPWNSPANVPSVRDDAGTTFGLITVP